MTILMPEKRHRFSTDGRKNKGCHEVEEGDLPPAAEERGHQLRGVRVIRPTEVRRLWQQHPTVARTLRDSLQQSSRADTLRDLLHHQPSLQPCDVLCGSDGADDSPPLHSGLHSEAPGMATRRSSQDGSSVLSSNVSSKL